MCPLRTFLTCALLLLPIACHHHKSHDRDRDDRVHDVRPSDLRASMTDDEILRAFDVDPRSAKVEFVQGKDGTSRTYHESHQQVTITRSHVSGVAVMADGKIKGLWDLGR